MIPQFTRRDFIRCMGLMSGTMILPSTQTSAIAASDVPLCAVDLEFYKDKTVLPARKKIKILVLGGTGFMGPPLVQYALERGHDVTLLNRGISNPHLFKQLKRIKVDRLKGLDRVTKEMQQPWDVVIDTWQLNPLAVLHAANIVKDYTGKFSYASSIAVYGRENYDTQQEIFEDLKLPPTERMPSSLSETVSDYKTRKILAEEAVLNTFGSRAIITRFHNIVGFYMAPDSEGQIYWPVRFQRGGNILLPGDGKDQMQTIDVKDASRWLIRSAENPLTGVYNAGRRYTWMEYAGACRALSDRECKLFWIPLEQLRENKIQVNSDMPYYIPRTWGPGFFNISDAKAVKDGIYYRPLSSTLTDVIDGFRRHYKVDYEFGPPNCNAGISRQREEKALHDMGLLSAR